MIRLGVLLKHNYRPLRRLLLTLENSHSRASSKANLELILRLVVQTFLRCSLQGTVVSYALNILEDLKELGRVDQSPRCPNKENLGGNP